MTEEERTKLKEIIQEHILKVEADIKELNELVKPVSLDASIGRISRMDAINNKSINEDALRKTQKRLQKLENIITIADTKEFGKCVRCGSEIPFGRLEFMPESRSCVKCARR
ncbi:MAG: TraR/DksA C4-type zinc finger protein [Balneolales bacterium]|nr:TraR/DksA C4-type zinc finger protein [Balneolales bacterium]